MFNSVIFSCTISAGCTISNFWITPGKKNYLDFNPVI